MEDKFTPRANQVLANAKKEADKFNHNFVGTEHVLLAILSLPECAAARILTKYRINFKDMEHKIHSLVGTGPDQKMIGNIPLTPRVKKILSYAQKEAEALKHELIGTEHVLFGVLREGDGVAARVLKEEEIDADMIREILKNPSLLNVGELNQTPEPSERKSEITYDRLEAVKRVLSIAPAIWPADTKEILFGFQIRILLDVLKINDIPQKDRESFFEFVFRDLIPNGSIGTFPDSTCNLQVFRTLVAVLIHLSPSLVDRSRHVKDMIRERFNESITGTQEDWNWTKMMMIVIDGGPIIKNVLVTPSDLVYPTVK